MPAVPLWILLAALPTIAAAGDPGAKSANATSSLAAAKAIAIAKSAGRLVQLGNKSYVTCDSLWDCVALNGHTRNSCYAYGLANGTDPDNTFAGKICGCMQYAGLTSGGTCSLGTNRVEARYDKCNGWNSH